MILLPEDKTYTRRSLLNLLLSSHDKQAENMMTEILNTYYPSSNIGYWLDKEFEMTPEVSCMIAAIYKDVENKSTKKYFDSINCCED